MSVVLGNAAVPRAGRRGRGGLLWASLASLAVFAALVSLGLWQIDRKRWKEDLIDRIATRAHGEIGEPLAESAWPRWRAEDDEFRRVRVTGTLLPAEAVPVLGLAELGPRQATQGVYLFTPVRRQDGSVLIVNRGFVPTELRDEVVRRIGDAPRAVDLVGLVRAPEAGSLFLPSNQPALDRWFTRSIAEMAEARRLGPRVAPFYVDADATPNPAGWPRGGQTPLTLRNTHLGYALTWFGLAATLVGVFGTFAWRILSADELQPDDAASHRPDTGEPGREEESTPSSC